MADGSGKVIGDEILVKFGVLLSSFGQALNQASDSLRANVEKMTGHLGKFDSAVISSKGGIDKLGTTLTSLASPFKKVEALWIGLTALIGGAAFKSAIDETVKLNSEAMRLANTLGTSSTEAAALNLALGDIGSDSDTYLSVFRHFNLQLRSNEEGLNKMGLKTRDANGVLRDSSSLMREAATVVGEYRAGIERTQASMVFFGRDSQSAAMLLRLTTERMEQARQKAQELGLTTTRYNVESTRAYKEAMNDLGDVLSGIRKTIGDAVLPAFAMLGSWMSEAGPTVVKVFKEAINSLMITFWSLRAVVNAVWETLYAFIMTLIEPFMAFGSAIKKLFEGDIAGAGERLKQVGPNIAQSWRNAFKDIGDATQDSIKRMDMLRNDTSGAWSPPEPPGGGKTMGALGKPQPDKSRMGEWEAALAEQKAVIEKSYAEQDRFREMSKDEERNYWRELMSVARPNLTEMIALRRKVADIDMASAKEGLEAKLAALNAESAQYRFNLDEKYRIEEQIRGMYEEGTREYENQTRKLNDIDRAREQQRMSIERTRIDAIKQGHLEVVQAEEDYAKFLLEIGGITNARLIELQATLEQRRFDISMQALQQQRALLESDRDQNKEALFRNQLEIETLQGEHQKRMVEINRRAFIESNKYTAQGLSELRSGISQLFNAIAQGQVTLHNIWRVAWKGLYDIATRVLSDLLADMIINFIKQKLLQVTTSASQIQANAAVAASAAFASVVGIPFVGPFLAPAAAAQAFASTQAWTLALPAAQYGFDVPAGLNPITKLHEKEMVLPAQLAENVREGALAAPRGDVHIHAIDGVSVKRFVDQNIGQFLDASDRARRNGYRPKR